MTMAPADQMTAFTGYLLLKLGEHTAGVIDRVLEPFGMRGRHVRVLGFLSHGPLSQRELAELTGMDRTTMVGVVDDLEAAGFATRERSPEDRRKHLVTRSPDGDRAYQRAAAVLAAEQGQFLAPLSQTERVQFHDMLARLFEAEMARCQK